MLMMPIAGLIVDRIGSARIAQLGIIVIVGGMVLFTQLEGDTSYWAIGTALFVLGLGMGMTMMPIMSAALKTLKPENVARASTSLNIIQQVAASIGTAMLSVILFNEIKDRLAPLAAAGGGAPTGNTTSITDLPEPARSQVASLMSEGYGATFVWALILLAVAFLPALLLPRGKGGPVVAHEGVVPITGADNEPPVTAADEEPVADQAAEPAGERK
jgi:MFS family permease